MADKEEVREEKRDDVTGRAAAEEEEEVVKEKEPKAKEQARQASKLSQAKPVQQAN